MDHDDEEERDCDECGAPAAGFQLYHCWACGGYFCGEHEDDHECEIEDGEQ